MLCRIWAIVHMDVDVVHNDVKPWKPLVPFVWRVCNSQGPPCGQRRKMRTLWCRWGYRWYCHVDPQQGCPLLSSSGWITVSCLHVLGRSSSFGTKSNHLFTQLHAFIFTFNIFPFMSFQTSRGYHWTNECPWLWMETCTFQMFSQKTAGWITSVLLAFLTHKPFSRSSLSLSLCSRVSRWMQQHPHSPRTHILPFLFICTAAQNKNLPWNLSGEFCPFMSHFKMIFYTFYDQWAIALVQLKVGMCCLCTYVLSVNWFCALM